MLTSKELQKIKMQIMNNYKYNYPGDYCKIKVPRYIPDAKDYRIAAISDIKQNGPATIIFLRNGKKVVVKCRDDRQNDSMGLYICLLKYLVPNRLYSSCINYIFTNKNMGEALMIANGMLLSHIDERDYERIYDKFFGYEED